MFKRKIQKRLVRVEVTLRHGGDKGDIKDIINILPGQNFLSEIEGYRILDGDTTVRTIQYRAGFTEDLEYFYQ